MAANLVRGSLATLIGSWLNVLSWFNENSNVLTMFANVAMVVIWIGYFQLFFFNYRRQNRSSLFITRAQGSGAEATILVTNMSAARFYVTNVLVVSPEKADWTEITERPANEECDSLQGPLGPGDTISLGSLVSLTGSVKSGDGEQDATVLVIGHHGTQEKPVGARRTFFVFEEDGELRSGSRSAKIEQLRSGADSKWLTRLREEFALK